MRRVLELCAVESVAPMHAQLDEALSAIAAARPPA
jgi:hypothetical protein